MTSFVPDLPDPAASRAVLLGVSGYRNLPFVPAATANVGCLSGILTDPALLGLPSEHVATLGDADVEGAGGVVAAIDHIRHMAQKAADALIVYFAGHGLRSNSSPDELYLALPDTTPEQRSYTALPFSEVASAVNDSRAARKIVIVDACFSGLALDAPVTAVRRGMAQLGDGVAMLASSPSTRPSGVAEGAEHTAFTGELLAILENGVDGGPALLDLETIYERLFAAFLDGRVTEPQLSSRGLGARIALVRNRRHWRGATTRTQDVDFSELIRALERITALAPDGVDSPAAAYRTVADGLTALRAGGVVETGLVFRLLPALAEIAESAHDRADQQADMTGARNHRESRVAEFVAAAEEAARAAHRSAAAAIPRLAADLEPRHVSFGTFARPDRTRELFDDLADQLARRVGERFVSDLRSRLVPLTREFVADLDHAEIAALMSGAAPAPALRDAFLAQVAEDLRRFFGIPMVVGAGDKLTGSGGAAVPRSWTMIFAQAQIAYVRGLVAAQMGRALSRPGTADDQAAWVAAQAGKWAQEFFPPPWWQRAGLRHVAVADARRIILQILESGS